MALEKTLGIIKPDAVKNGFIGKILDHAARVGFRVCAIRMIRMSKATAESFYDVHVGKPFFDGLVEFMTEGPCVVFALEREDAVAHWRLTLGATNPEKAAEGTIRKLYAESFTRNAAHGSDSVENAAREVAFFFPTSEQF
jgi:nucleoside-diphosphate kinase